jgi:hypothetical protein
VTGTAQCAGNSAVIHRTDSPAGVSWIGVAQITLR